MHDLAFNNDKYTRKKEKKYFVNLWDNKTSPDIHIFIENLNCHTYAKGTTKQLSYLYKQKVFLSCTKTSTMSIYNVLKVIFYFLS